MAFIFSQEGDAVFGTASKISAFASKISNFASKISDFASKISEFASKIPDFATTSIYDRLYDHKMAKSYLRLGPDLWRCYIWIRM